MLIISLDHDIELFLYIEEMYAELPSLYLFSFKS